jgi:predicted nucleic acid-binding protein
VIYLDSAAIVKLAHAEAESADLRSWLAERAGVPRVTSALAEVEVPRAIHRHAPASLPHVPLVLGTIARFEIDIAVRALAASYADPLLRSLDAIHLATAQVLNAELDESLQAFVTYDQRLLTAAQRAGLAAASPGLDPG